MSKRFYAGTSLILLVALITVALGAVLASGGTKGSGARFFDYPAAAFVPVTSSTNNNTGRSVCGAFAARQPMDPGLLNSENRGDLNAIKGSNLNEVHLLQGDRVRSLTLFANDNDADTNAVLLLIRKQLKGGLSPQFNGYKVLGKVASSGAVNNTMRRFTRRLPNPAIDNRHNDYYLELVVCGTVEPFAAQLVVTH